MQQIDFLVLRRMDQMCAESLSVEGYSMWEEVVRNISENRTILKHDFLSGSDVCDICGEHRNSSLHDKPLLGMYAVSDPSYPQVKVGDFTICRQDDQSVWIQRECGEGGQFSDSVFSAALEVFWKENF